MAENEKTTEVAAEAAEVKKEEKKPAKKAAKNKVPFTVKMGNFFRACKSELKKISWYGRKDTVNSTILVVIVLIVCSAAISLMDYGFSTVVQLLGRLL